MKRLGWICAVLVVACGRPAESPKPKSPSVLAQAPSAGAVPPKEPPAAAASAEPADPELPSSPFSGPAMQRHPNDLGWLAELVQVLSDVPATREQVADYLGKDAGADMAHPGGRMVRGHSPYFETVAVYAVVQRHAEVAIDIQLKSGSQPGRSSLDGVLSPLQPLPPVSGEGPKLSHDRKGKHATARVLIELDKASTQVVSLHVEVEGPRQ